MHSVSGTFVMHYAPLSIVLGLGKPPAQPALALVQPFGIAAGFSLYSLAVRPSETYGCDELPRGWAAPTGVLLVAALYSGLTIGIANFRS